MENIKHSLKKIFGFSQFRENQYEIIEAIMAGRDVFASMPTGGGKSLCYQLPACELQGTAVVISPLIALMKDQVDSARSLGIRAEYLNSTLSSAEISSIYKMLSSGEVDLLYVAPERFALSHFMDFLKQINISFIAVDEAHCISQWGHDFRPDYLSLGRIKSEFINTPVAAFTATATSKVQQDIIENLNLGNPFIVRASFDRTNLFYNVIPKSDVNHQIFNFIKIRKNESGIVYRSTRKNVETTYEFLKQQGFNVLPYHAGLNNDVRKSHQEAFNRDEVQVVVATIAFGMGIDKSNIRYVIHGDLPKSMESYYQETGRAGRDGELADCIMFFGRSDIPRIRYFIAQMNNQWEKQQALDKLDEIVSFASVNICRRKQILEYFNEKYEKENCELCDVCTGNVQRVDCTTNARIIMSAIARTDQQFGAGHIVDLVYGANTKKIREFKHNEIKTYGAGKFKAKLYWRTLIDYLVADKHIVQTTDQYPKLSISESGREILLGHKDFFTYEKTSTVESYKYHKEDSYDDELFEILRAVRKDIAKGENVPPFVVFSDKTLHDMCSIYPTNGEEMLMVSGVGEKKLERYGAEFLVAIKDYLKDKPHLSENRKIPLVLKVSTPPKEYNITETMERTYLLLNEGFTYKEVASQRGLSEATVLGHMEKLQGKGRPMDVQSHIDREKLHKIIETFGRLNTTMLRPVVDTLNGLVSYEEARLGRIYFNGLNGVSK